MHEQLVNKVAAQMAPALTLCISSEVLPEIKEYERTSTTVINAYVRPIVEKYLSALTAELARIGVDAPLLLAAVRGAAIHRPDQAVSHHGHAVGGASASGTEISNPVSSSGESTNYRFAQWFMGRAYFIWQKRARVISV